MTNYENFNPDIYRQQIDELLYPALEFYLSVLKNANVPEEDIFRILEVVAGRAKTGLRKANELAELMNQLR